MKTRRSTRLELKKVENVIEIINERTSSEENMECSEDETKTVDDSEKQVTQPLFTIDTTPGSAYTSRDLSDDSDSTDTESEPETESKPKGKRDGLALSSSLQTQPGADDTYLDVDFFKAPSISNRKIDKLLQSDARIEQIMKNSVLKPGVEKLDKLPPYRESIHQLKKKRRQERAKTKGDRWFGMKRAETTEEKTNELQVLKMRRALDPKRFYKSDDIPGTLRYFQTGRILDGHADFHNRIPKKDRHKSLVDELLADTAFKEYHKKKSVEIKEAKKRGTGAYKRMKRLKKQKK